MWIRTQIWLTSFFVLRIAGFFISIPLFVMHLFTHGYVPTDFNLNEVDPSELIKADPRHPVLLAFGAVLGIFSKIFFDLLSASDEALMKIVESRLNLVR